MAGDCKDGSKRWTQGKWLATKTYFLKPDPVVQVINDKTKEILYTVRVQGKTFHPKVYSSDPHSLKVGKDAPKKLVFSKTIPIKQKEGCKDFEPRPLPVGFSEA